MMMTTILPILNHRTRSTPYLHDYYIVDAPCNNVYSFNGRRSMFGEQLERPCDYGDCNESSADDSRPNTSEDVV